MSSTKFHSCSTSRWSSERRIGMRKSNVPPRLRIILRSCNRLSFCHFCVTLRVRGPFRLWGSRGFPWSLRLRTLGFSDSWNFGTPASSTIVCRRAGKIYDLIGINLLYARVANGFAPFWIFRDHCWIVYVCNARIYLPNILV